MTSAVKSTNGEPDFGDVDDLDDFDLATTAFKGVGDLEGCLTLIYPISEGEAKGDDGPYTFVKCDIVVLDGKPTNDIDAPTPEKPVLLEDIRIQTQGMVDALLIQLRRKGGRPRLGRISGHPSKRNKLIKWHRQDDPIEADIPQGRRGVAFYKANQNTPFD